MIGNRQLQATSKSVPPSSHPPPFPSSRSGVLTRHISNRFNNQGSDQSLSCESVSRSAREFSYVFFQSECSLHGITRATAAATGRRRPLRPTARPRPPRAAAPRPAVIACPYNGSHHRCRAARRLPVARHLPPHRLRADHPYRQNQPACRPRHQPARQGGQAAETATNGGRPSVSSTTSTRNWPPATRPAWTICRRPRCCSRKSSIAWRRPWPRFAAWRRLCRECPVDPAGLAVLFSLDKVNRHEHKPRNAPRRRCH